MKNKVFVIVDAGHGGNHPTTGVYMTRKDWGKYFQFINPDGTLDFEIREGVINRIIANKFCKMLGDAGIAYEKIYHAYNDTPLEVLAQKANKIHFEKARQGYKCILLSFHSNASGNNFRGLGAAARGISFWTTKGVTQADKIADIWFDEHKKLCNSIAYRADYSDGDKDYEEQFYILYNTSMPAVLVENLFFDNKEDAKLLLSEDYQNSSAQAALNTVKRIQNEIEF